MLYKSISYFIATFAAVHSKIYFKEDFNDAGWKDRWVVPTQWKAKVIY